MKGMKNRFLSMVWTILLCASVMDVWANASEVENPFSGVRTHVLSNGLKLWHRVDPSQPNVSIGVCIPYGHDQDPVGLEQLAHFTEHMLFADRNGKTEKQIKQEMTDLGGEHNGVTYRDRTVYFVHIGREHGLKALRWMFDLISPHPMGKAVVDQQRGPVLLELNARPREAMDWIQAWIMENPRWDTPGFWEDEYGMESRHSRDIDHYRSVHRIGSDELKAYYDRYYVPSQMTLFVSGAMPEQEVLEMVESTFATLPSKPEPDVGQEAVLKLGSRNVTHFKHK